MRPIPADGPPIREPTALRSGVPRPQIVRQSDSDPSPFPHPRWRARPVLGGGGTRRRFERCQEGSKSRKRASMCNKILAASYWAQYTCPWASSRSGSGNYAISATTDLCPLVLVRLQRETGRVVAQVLGTQPVRSGARAAACSAEVVASLCQAKADRASETRSPVARLEELEGIRGPRSVRRSGGFTSEGSGPPRETDRLHPYVE